MNITQPHFISELGFLPSSTLFILFSACLIYWLLNYSRWAGWFAASEDVVAPYVSVPALLFGLYASVLSTDVWNRYNELNTVVVQEANAVRGIILLSESLAVDEKSQLTLLANQYLYAVVNEEWMVMREGQVNDDCAAEELGELSRYVIGLGQKEHVPKTVEARLHQLVDTVSLARLKRYTLAVGAISISKWRAVVLFGVLLLVGVAVVHLRRPRAMLISMTITVAGVLLTLVLLGNNQSPFTGPNPVTPVLLQESMTLSN